MGFFVSAKSTRYWLLQWVSCLCSEPGGWGPERA